MAGEALQDIRVLDLSQQLPGPFATRLLAELGAEVIKVEPPGGDAARGIDRPMFEIVNAGKRSVVVDLKSSEGRDQLLGLVESCDVFVEGFRPGTVERLGCAYPEVHGVRNSVVYCSLSGYGSNGPYRDVPGHDLNYLGVAAGASAEESGEIGVPFIDMGSGTTAALAIVAAIRQRDMTGEGCHLDLAMLDVANFWAGVKIPPEGGSEPAYGAFRAADGKVLTLAVIEDKFWRNLCDCLGWTDWRDAPELADHEARRRRGVEIEDRLTAAIAARPREDLLDLFWGADIPAAPLNRPADVLSDPQIRARGLAKAAIGDGGGSPTWQPVSVLPPALRGADLAGAPVLGGDSDGLLS